MQQLVVLHLAYQDKRTPWAAKILIILILAYALSPIDLIPDFIPVLGLLDDLVLLPVGIYLAFKLIPTEVVEECRIKAQTYQWSKKKSWAGAALALLCWGLLLFFIVRHFNLHRQLFQF